MSIINTLTSVIIDVGLDVEAYEKYRDYTSFLVVTEGVVADIDKTQLLDYTSHGSECLRYFEMGSKSVANYFILLQNNDDGKCNILDLIVALDWCVDNGISLISLSMGTTVYSDAALFSDVLKRISDAGICIVAGASNGRSLSFPACLNGVVGVAHDYTFESISGDFAYFDDPFDGVDIVLNPKVTGDLIDSNSMATAYFSGLVFNAFRNNIAEPHNVKKWIADNAGSLTLFKNSEITSSIKERFSKFEWYVIF